MSVNKVFLQGRLGKDPEIFVTQSGMSIAKFSLATSERVRNQDGSYGNKTEWHNIVVFGKSAENCGKFLQKGSSVFIEGSISTRQYTNKQGQEVYITEIKALQVTFLDSKGESQGNTQQFNNRKVDMPETDDDSDDLPF